MKNLKFLNIEKIIISLANLLNLRHDQINLKGKTVEKLGLIGKEKAIACETIVSIKNMFKFINTAFVTLFGIGKLPKIPGSYASLVTVIFYILFHF